MLRAASSSVRAGGRAFSTNGGGGNKPAAAAAAATTSSPGLFTNKPGAAAKAPAAAAAPPAAGGATAPPPPPAAAAAAAAAASTKPALGVAASGGGQERKEGLGLFSIAVPVMVAAALGGAYYAYKEGAFDDTLKSVRSAVPDTVAAQLPPPAKAATKPVAAVAPPPSPSPPPPPAPKPKPAPAPVPPAAPAAAAPAPVVEAAKPTPAPPAAPAPAPAAPAPAAAKAAAPAPAADAGAALDTAAALARTVLTLDAADAELAASRAALKAAADVPPVAESIPLAATTPLESAKAASQAWTTKQVAAALQDSAKSAVLEEVDALSTTQLRERVLQLSNELSVRSKWEAMHLIEMLGKADERWSAMFEAYAKAKDEEAAAAAEERVHSIRATLEEEFSASLERAKRAMGEQLAADSTAKLRAVTRELFERVGKETDDRVAALNTLRAKVASADAVLQSRRAYEVASWRVHRLSVAARAAAEALQEPRPSTTALASLVVAADGDAVITKALAMLPKEVHSARGVASLNTLQVRFAAASKAARVAALTPEGSGVLGQALGAATSMLVVTPAAAAASPAAPAADAAPRPAPSSNARAVALPPIVTRAWDGVKAAVASLLPVGAAESPAAVAADALPANVVEGARKGMDVVKEIAAVAAEKTSDVTRVHALFDRADAAVAAGDLPAALAVLAPLTGAPADALADWSAAARLRIDADAATAAVRARTAVLTAALY